MDMQSHISKHLPWFLLHSVIFEDEEEALDEDDDYDNDDGKSNSGHISISIYVLYNMYM
jgi:hypothetical protein